MTHWSVRQIIHAEKRLYGLRRLKLKTESEQVDLLHDKPPSEVLSLKKAKITEKNKIIRIYVVL